MTPKQKETTLQSRVNASSKGNTKPVLETVCEENGENCQEEDNEKDEEDEGEDGEGLEEHVSVQYGSMRNQGVLPGLTGRMFLHSVVVPETDRPVPTIRKMAAAGRAKSVKKKRRRSVVERGEGVDGVEQAGKGRENEEEIDED